MDSWFQSSGTRAPGSGIILTSNDDGDDRDDCDGGGKKGGMSGRAIAAIAEGIIIAFLLITIIAAIFHQLFCFRVPN